MQMAVVVRACIQQYATHYQCGALCVLTSTRTVDCCTIYNNIRVNRICVRGTTHEYEVRHSQHNCRWAYVFTIYWVYNA